MKRSALFFLPLMFFVNQATAQDFNERFYYEQLAGYDEARTGSIHGVNDTLAEILFKGPVLGDNFSFPCAYRFSNDTLYMTQLESDIDLNRMIEYSRTEYLDKKYDSIYLGYQVDYYDGGSPKYQDVFFEVNHVKTANSRQCDSYCAVIKRPDTNDFTISIWTGAYLLDEFEVHLPFNGNVVRMSKDILSGGGWWDVDRFVGKIPGTIYLDGKLYVLVCKLNSYSIHFFPKG